MFQEGVSIITSNIRELVCKGPEEIEEENKQIYDRMIKGEENESAPNSADPRILGSMRSSSSQSSSLHTFR